MNEKTCGGLMVLVGVPFLLLSVPALLQAVAGDWAAWNGLLDQGWHLIGFWNAVICCLVMILGYVFEESD